MTERPEGSRGQVATRKSLELLPPNSRTLVPTWELLWAFVAKELRVKYKRSVLGFFWSLLTPIALAAVYLFVFIYVYKVPKENYILELLSGLLPWNYFNLSIISATSSLVTQGSIIRKVYFNRSLIPLSSVGANLINFLLAMAIFVPVVAVAGTLEVRRLPLLVLAIVLQTAMIVGASLLLSILNVYLRDIQQVIGLLMTVFFFATPIVYGLSQVPAGFRPFILANPLTPVMELYRAVLIGADVPPVSVIALGLGQAAALLLLGYGIFSRFSRHLAKEV